LEGEESVSFDELKEENILGIYDILNNSLYALYSHGSSNYIFLKDQSIEITEGTEINYRVNYAYDEISYFEIIQDGKQVIREEYMSNREPLLDPFGFEDDWEYVNFAYHISLGIEQAKADLKLPIFPV
jgi:hypothetical protein